MVFIFASNFAFSTASMSTTDPWSVGAFDAAAFLSDPVVLDAGDLSSEVGAGAAGFPAAVGGAALS